MPESWIADWQARLGLEKLEVDPAIRERLSKDYYWYSPVLEKQLAGKVAEAVVIPEQEEEMAEILSLAARYRIPVTVRGAGTGNYGQAVPLNGGIVLDTSRLDRIVEISEDSVRVQVGVRLGKLERALREQGQELCIYPSTYMKSTAGGFVCGGSGGIGSITWGNLWDGNVLEATVWTVQEEPKKLHVSGKSLLDYIHGYGTTGVLSEVVLRIAPRTDWMQAMAFFDELDDALQFSHALACEPHFKKRLISPNEWPIPSFFLPLEKAIQPGEAAVLLELEEGSLPRVETIASEYGGEVGYTVPAGQYHQGIGVSDFSWNHTTLWARKVEPQMTYLQAGFSPDRFLEQVHLLKDRFGDEVLLHFEWIRNNGVITPQALPLVRYQDARRLYEIIGYCESIGVIINDPHTYLLEAGGRSLQFFSMLQTKQVNDPYGLLNPGKISEERQTATMEA